MKRLPILMYHRVDSRECPVHDREELRYAVGLDEFIWQIDFLRGRGLKGVTVCEAIEALHRGEAPPDGVVLTFDDGNRSDYIHALPILKDRGFAATFFLSAERIGRGDGLDEEMIQELLGAGMEIGSHGMTHRFLTRLSKGEIKEECARSREIIGDLIGCEVTSFAPPGGRLNKTALAVLQALPYKAVCTSEFGFNTPGTNVLRLKRIPVTSDISRAIFAAVAAKSRLRLTPMYFRYHILQLLRTVLGESAYRRFRSITLGE